MIVATRPRMPAIQTPPRPTAPTQVPPLVTPLRVQPAITAGQPASSPASPPLRVVDRLPQSLPPWLVTLMTIRKLSTPVVTVIILGILPLYGWSVYTQRSWGKTYQRLENIRREEHTLLLLNEAHKYQVTQKAEQNTAGLTRKGPHNTLFVSPARHKPGTHDGKEPSPVTPEWVLPIGY